MRSSSTNCSTCNHNPLHCIIPPYIFESLSESPDEDIRNAAIQNIKMAAIVRTQRTLIPPSTVSILQSVKKTKYREVYDLQNQPNYNWLLPGSLVRKEGDSPVKDSAVNEAYDYSGHTYDFYDQIFSRNSLDDNGLSLISTVHIGKNHSNAFWNGNQMGYGDGDGKLFNRFTKSLDVIGHEFTHGIISFTSALVYRNESGAINEHLADVFGTLIKQWVNNEDVHSANWLIGEDIIVQANTRRAIRDMKNPGNAFVNDPHIGTDPQPDHISNKYTGTNDFGGVHINSGILNKAFCETAMRIGGYAWIDSGRIWYDAMLQLTPNSNFADLVRLTKSIAAHHYGKRSVQYRAVNHGWKKVGL